MFLLIDEDGDGKITLDESVSSLTDRSGYPELSEVRPLFESIKVTKDGMIDYNELKKSLGEKSQRWTAEVCI